jgi:hypothetical protein
MVKKNIYPESAIFYRVTYEVGIYDFCLDFTRGKKQ